MQEPTPYYQIHDRPHEKAEPFMHHHQTPYQPYQPTDSPATAPSTGTILNVKRSVGLGVVAALVFLLLAVIGLSAGLGISQRELQRARSDLDTVQAMFSSALAAGTAGATSVAVAPTAATASAAPSPTASSEVTCPRVNGTVYTASSGGKQFRRMCGIDYGGKGEAVDIGNVKTRNLDTCIDACAAKTNCTGAGWGVIEGDTGPLHACWMKTNLTKAHKATPDWGFAVLVPSVTRASGRV